MAESVLKQSEVTKTKLSRNSKAVQGTNDSSIRSKWSAASRGYFSDEYLTDICKSGVLPNGQGSCVRTPVINRGYWVRVHAIDHVITKFLDTYNKSNLQVQIISLGAGYDSTYFRLASLGYMQSCCYIEVDFPELLSKKLNLIQKTERVAKFFPSLNEWHPLQDSPSIIFDSPNYKLVGADLNDLQLFSNLLKSVNVDFKKPTLLLSEVVLVYLNPDSSSNIIQWAAESFQDAVFLTYEQVYPDDAFGAFMCRHFKNIGTSLKSITKFPTIPSQVHRYCSLGWTESVASDMNYFFNNVISSTERLRIDSVEMFDEYEEWHLKCMHYVLVTAFKGLCTSLKDVIWSEPSTFVPLCSCDVTNSMTSSGIVEIESDGHLAFSCSATCEVPASESVVDRLKIESKCSQPELWNRVYGHTCDRLTISGENVILVVGGFGAKRLDKAHRRMSCCSVVWVDKQNDPVEIPLIESMYHTLTPISHKEVVIFGGRTSPAKPSADVFLLGLDISSADHNQITKNLRKVETFGERPCPRWRHSAAFLIYKGSPVVVVFGGRSCANNFLDDCWMLNCTTWTWEEIRGTGDLPCGRHSHTSEVWQSKVLFICGLGPNQTPIDSIHLLDMTTFVWQKLELVGDLIYPRYSHTSALHRNRLILVGGVSLSHEFSPVSVIDLETGSVTNFVLKIPVQAFPTMLHNLDSACLEEDENSVRLILVGGGGNCFSFGTHLNDFPLTMTV